MPTHPHELAGQTIALTGAGGGIGRATAHHFAEVGAQLLLLDRDLSAIQTLRDTLPGQGHVAASFDQADPHDIERAVALASKADVLINNAGITHRAALTCTDYAAIQHVLTVNVTGAIALSVGIAKHMLERRRGVIINVTSQFAQLPAPGRAIYGASKAAMTHFTRSAAAEWGKEGLTVVALAPGPVDTPMLKGLRDNPQAMQALLNNLPTGRLTHANEIAALAVHLAQFAPGTMNGETILMDGGYVLTTAVG